MMYCKRKTLNGVLSKKVNQEFVIIFGLTYYLS